jgi:putative methionine-R-sulfoxide reductase with GAF domain
MSSADREKGSHRVFEREKDPDGDRLRREARVAGLRDFRTPSLEAVERRRLRLWLLTTVGLVAVAAGVLALVRPSTSSAHLLSEPLLRLAVFALALAFCVYAIEKEFRLGRTTRLLTDERVLTAALTNRLHEASLLLEAGRAMNAVLDLPELLQTVLRSACELLDANGGSVMLVDGDELVTLCVRGREEAVGARLRLGEGVAGHVALRREPVLIDGYVDPNEFPGLADREPYVESAMSLPLIHRDEVVGVLNINAAVGRAFTEYDLRAVAVFAEQAATAVANARLYEAERAHVAELIELRHRHMGEAG